MWIKAKVPFIDKLAENPEDADVPVGKKLNVTADRGRELIDLGLVEEITAAPAAPAGKASRPRKKAAPKEKEDATSAPLADETPTASAAAEIGTHPIVLGTPEPIDGPEAVEDTTND